jgi:hypothetical protein
MNDDLDARLRALFGDADLGVSTPAGTDARILAGARRARRRATTVRSVSAVAAAAAAGGTVAAMVHAQDGSTRVIPARSPSPCQEYYTPPTPTGTETMDWRIPTYAGPAEPGDLPGWTATTRPRRGPRGGVLCYVENGRPYVLAEDGSVWPTELPVPAYRMPTTVPTGTGPTATTGPTTATQTGTWPPELPTELPTGLPTGVSTISLLPVDPTGSP